MAGCDHRSIACFSSREDKNYCLIVKKIKRLIKYGGEPTAIMLDNVNTLQSEQQTRKSKSVVSPHFNSVLILLQKNLNFISLQELRH